MGRDRFWLIMTALAVGWFAAIYYFLPATVEETIVVGVHWTELESAFDAAFEGREGLEFVRFASTAELERALGVGTEGEAAGRDATGDVAHADGKEGEAIDIGIDYPQDFLVKVTVGMPTTVTLYVEPSVPHDVRDALSTYVRESAFALTGNPLPIGGVEQNVVVVGEDRVGDQVPLREKMRPLLVFFMLVMEVFALGVLIAEEVRTRTVTAVLATPARVSDFLTAKGIVGTIVAFSEALLLVLLLRALGAEPLVVVATLALGAVLVTGVALIVGASGRDFIGVIFYSMLFLVPLMIPAVAALFPGSPSSWIKIIPTYGLVQALIGASTYGQGMSELMPYLLGLLLWCVVIAAVGLAVLRRRVVTL